MSEKFDSRKDLQSTKFEQRPQIFVKLSFRELWDSKLCGLHAFDNMAIVERSIVSSWDTNFWNNFSDSHWEIICHNKWHPGSLETSTPTEMAAGMHFHEQTWH